MEATASKVTIPALQKMKRDGKKIVGVVAWDYPIAQIAERARVDLVSVGDSVDGGLGGGPRLDGRVRLASTAIGYGGKWLDAKTETYVNTAKLSLQAFTALVDDVRAGRQIKG